MDRVHRLLTLQVLLLVLTSSVQVERKQLFETVNEMSPIVAVASVLDTLSTDPKLFDKEPHSPGEVGLPVHDFTMGGLKLWIRVLADSNDLRTWYEQEAIPPEDYRNRRSDARSELGWDNRFAEDQRREAFELSLESVFDFAENEECSGLHTVRAGLVAAIFGQVGYVVLVNDGFDNELCITKREQFAGTEGHAVYSLAVAQRELERIAQSRGMAGEHWGKTYLKLRGMLEAQRIQLPLVQVPVPVQGVFTALSALSLALLVWTSIVLRREYSTKNLSSNIEFSLAENFREDGLVDAVVASIERLLLGAFYCLALVAPSLIAAASSSPVFLGISGVACLLVVGRFAKISLSIDEITFPDTSVRLQQALGFLLLAIGLTWWASAAAGLIDSSKSKTLPVGWLVLLAVLMFCSGDLFLRAQRDRRLTNRLKRVGGWRLPFDRRWRLQWRLGDGITIYRLALILETLAILVLLLTAVVVCSRIVAL